jgi:hypothetical protein
VATRKRLSGYPETMLGRSSITVTLPSGAVLAGAVSAVAAQHDKLDPALLHADSRPRRSTKTLLNGAVADLNTAIPAGASVTVLAALPCDGSPTRREPITTCGTA